LVTVAANCCVAPSFTTGLVGEIEIDTALLPTVLAVFEGPHATATSPAANTTLQNRKKTMAAVQRGRRGDMGVPFPLIDRILKSGAILWLLHHGSQLFIGK
jgi:hypothetical protein